QKATDVRGGVGDTAMAALEMQAIGCDCAVQSMQRCTCSACSRRVGRIGCNAHDLVLKPRGLPIADEGRTGHLHPGLNSQWIGRRGVPESDTASRDPSDSATGQNLTTIDKSISRDIVKIRRAQNLAVRFHCSLLTIAPVTGTGSKRLALGPMIHSITSSAATRSVSGTVRSSAF